MEEKQKKCPICGNNNNCQHGMGGCWCDKVVFPKKVLDMIPKEKIGKACVCRNCLEKYGK
ncbi:MAG: cysteine-rich CWC family protein [Solirubrobacterales bacterium]